MDRKRGRSEARAEIAEIAKNEPEALIRHIDGIESALARVSVTLALQGRRIDEEDFDVAQREMDALILAADQLKKISSAMRIVGFDVEPVQRQFDAATPNVTAARDVFSHYEDYLLGTGNRQCRIGEPVSMFYARSALGGTAVHMTNPDIVVDVGAAIDAAAHLAAGLQTLLEQGRAMNTSIPQGIEPPRRSLNQGSWNIRDLR